MSRFSVPILAGLLAAFSLAGTAQAESIKFPPPSPLVFCKDGHGGHVQHAPCPPRPPFSGERSHHF